MLHWLPLETDAQLAALLATSHTRPQIIFKHSTRCSISEVAKTRLESATAVPDADFHYLDLIRFRPLSNKIAEDLRVYHESPQVLLIRNGECVYDESHLSIRMDDLADAMNSAV
jgi:bacillithiol system protein YtxJ